MNTGFLIVIVLLMLLLFCFVLFYVLTQQSLRDITFRLDSLHPAKSAPVMKRSVEAIRRERAFCHDKLVVLEASLSTAPRDDLTPEEVVQIDQARKVIKSCIDELKACGDWLGLPFDFEWTEILDRLPNVNALYRKAAAIADSSAASDSAESAKPAGVVT